MNFKNPSRMNESQTMDCITHKLPKLYKSETGKKFINHLVNAFYTDKPQYVLYIKDEDVITDCITNRILKPVFPGRPSKEEYDKFRELLTHDSAVKSTASNKLMGVTEFNYFKEWVDQEIAAGNEDITKIVNFNKNKQKPKKINNKSKNRNKSFSRPKGTKKYDSRKSLAASDDIREKLTKVRNSNHD